MTPCDKMDYTMGNFLRQLFSDKGNVSMMRVLSLTCVIAACCIAMYGLHQVNVDYSGLTLLCSAFLSAGIGGKIVQKVQEVKTKSVDNPD